MQTRKNRLQNKLQEKPGTDMYRPTDVQTPIPSPRSQTNGGSNYGTKKIQNSSIASEFSARCSTSIFYRDILVFHYEQMYMLSVSYNIPKLFQEIWDKLNTAVKRI